MELTSRASALIAIALLSILIGAASIPLFLNKISDNMTAATVIYDDTFQDLNGAVRGKDFPVITAENQRIKVSEAFNPKSWVTVTDTLDGDISQHVEVYGTIDNTTKGDYEIRYSIRNSFGLKSDKKIRIIVD